MRSSIWVWGIIHSACQRPFKTILTQQYSLKEACLELLSMAVLFAVATVAEIVGCYLPWLVVRQEKSAWLLIPVALVGMSIIALQPRAGA